ncbi:UNVERIFIED_CONTAM: hypothetical protein FKN15_022490 [Acipenser sinensis]
MTVQHCGTSLQGLAAICVKGSMKEHGEFETPSPRRGGTRTLPGVLQISFGIPNLPTFFDHLQPVLHCTALHCTAKPAGVEHSQSPAHDSDRCLQLVSCILHCAEVFLNDEDDEHSDPSCFRIRLLPYTPQCTPDFFWDSQPPHFFRPPAACTALHCTAKPAGVERSQSPAHDSDRCLQLVSCILHCAEEVFLNDEDDEHSDPSCFRIRLLADTRGD